MTNYARGRAAEYRAKRLLEGRGWVVFRSAGSHSAADLIAMRWGAQPGVLVVQVKRNAYLSRIERTNLHGLKKRLPTNAQIQVWRFVGRQLEVETL